MRKKIGYLILFIALFWITSSNVYALTCEYDNKEGHSASFEIYSDGSVSRVTLDVCFECSNSCKNETEPIKNWDEASGDTTFAGKAYYDFKHECPPYMIVMISKIRTLYVFVRGEDEPPESDYLKWNESRWCSRNLTLVKPKEPEEEPEEEPKSCFAMTDRDSCVHNPDFSCIWNETKYGDYCNTDNLLYVYCADGVRDIPYRVPEITSYIYNLLKIATPIILIVVSIITLLKALVSSKEEDIKKAQHSLIKKIIAAVLVFFIMSIVQFTISIVADNDSDNNKVSNCLDCFLNGSCNGSVYYKSTIGGVEQERNLKDLKK